MKKDTLIEVEWDDTCVNMSWQDDESASRANVTSCLSVGYFINQDKRALRISHSRQPGGNCRRDVSAIPVGCIMKIRRIK